MRSLLLVSTVLALAVAIYATGAGFVGGVYYGPCQYTQNDTTFGEYCPDAVVNNVSVKCREYWMRYAMQVQFNGSAGTPTHMCPMNFFGAVVVNHTDTSPENPHDEDGNNCGALVGQSLGDPDIIYKDPTGHGELNATREVSKKFGVGWNRSFWGKLTQYTTGESCGMCASHQVWAGYKEVVYGVRVGDLIDMGVIQIAINSYDIYRKQVLANPPNPKVVIRDVLREEIKPYFAWVYNSSAPCPAPCVPNTSGSPRCVMPSTPY